MTDKLSESRLAEIGKAHQEVCDDLEFSLDSMAEAVDAHNHRLELLCHIDHLQTKLDQFQYKQVLLQLKNITVELHPPDQALLETDPSEYIRQSQAFQSQKQTRDSAIRELERIAEETQ